MIRGGAGLSVVHDSDVSLNTVQHVRPPCRMMLYVILKELICVIEVPGNNKSLSRRVFWNLLVHNGEFPQGIN